ncbi:MAG: hypothetical protein IPJ18_22270 [Betaproteobacteria bacterium]|nr:hypothetical protein [Betaproteobacteria bacterium]
MGTLPYVDILAYATLRFQEPELESRRVADIITTNKQDESRVHLRDGRSALAALHPGTSGRKTLRVWSFRRHYRRIQRSANYAPQQAKPASTVGRVSGLHHPDR